MCHYCFRICISSCSAKKRLTDEDLAKVFSIHDVSCYYCCDNSKITGPRWIYKWNRDYSVCQRHVPDKHNWYRKLFPWDSSSSPNSSVALCERGSNIRHIQCVLTKKGYLSIKDFKNGKIQLGVVDQPTCSAIGRYRSRPSPPSSSPSPPPKSCSGKCCYC